jgi:hypothetical protein
MGLDTVEKEKYPLPLPVIEHRLCSPSLYRLSYPDFRETSMSPKQSLLTIAVRIFFLNENASQELASGHGGWEQETRLRDVWSTCQPRGRRPQFPQSFDLPPGPVICIRWKMKIRGPFPIYKSHVSVTYANMGHTELRERVVITYFWTV